MAMPPSRFSLNHVPEVSVTRLTRRERLAALPRAIGFVLLRLLRIERRSYLVIDGKVAARFVAHADGLDCLRWLSKTHASAFDFGLSWGRDSAQHSEADAGQPGSS